MIQRSIGLMLLILSLVGSQVAFASVNPGTFQGTAAFGDFTFLVNEEGTAITEVKFNWSNWTCGPITFVSGSITVSRGGGGWDITDNQFSIDFTLYRDPFNPNITAPMTFGGTFADSGDRASGSWEADVLGAICSGTWEAAQAQIQIAEQDSLALVALYQATDGPNWIDNTDWMTGPVRTWKGVELTGNRVTSLHLHSNHLTGEIPAELGNLTDLDWLKLDDNGLTGEIPAELGNLTSLTRLALNRNQLTGEIPAALGNLTELIALNVGENRLTGALPAALGNLTSLTTLHANLNQLTGELPAELGNLTSLTSLDFGDNELTGEIPAALGNLEHLTALHLGVNQLTGVIPTALGNLANLTSLWLAQNQLTGEIPAWLGNLTSLTALDLGANGLSGEIPAGLGDLTGLTTLSLYGNQLTGEIPTTLGHLTSLTELDLNANPLTGEVPVEFGNLTQLTHLALHYTGLEGTLPMSLTNLSALDVFHFNDTNLCEPVDEAFQAWLRGVSDVQSTGCINVAAEEATPVPADFALHQNYPNPFNPETTIRYDVPQPGHVKLVVYDMLGRQVRVLVDGVVAAGIHEVRFDAGWLPSGVYGYRLGTPVGSFTKTMHLLK